MKTVIKDELISPYETHIDEHNFTVGTPYVNKDGDTVLIGGKYYTSLDRALKFIVKSNMIKEDRKYSIKEYISDYLSRLEKIKQLINI